MKSIIALGLVLLMSTLVHAGRVITCDPQEGVTHHKLINVATGERIDFPAFADGACNIPLNAVLNKTEYDLQTCVQTELTADYPDGSTSTDLSEDCVPELTRFRIHGNKVYVYPSGLKQIKD